MIILTGQTVHWSSECLAVHSYEESPWSVPVIVLSTLCPPYDRLPLPCWQRLLQRLLHHELTRGSNSLVYEAIRHCLTCPGVRVTSRGQCHTCLRRCCYVLYVFFFLSCVCLLYCILPKCLGFLLCCSIALSCLCYIVLHFSILFCTVQYCSVLYCITVSLSNYVVLYLL